MMHHEANSYAELGGPSGSAQDDAFEHEVAERIKHERARFAGCLLTAACAMWQETECGGGAVDRAAHFDLRAQLKRSDAIGYVTYREYTTGKNTPQVEAVEHRVNAKERAERLARRKAA